MRLQAIDLTNRHGWLNETISLPSRIDTCSARAVTCSDCTFRRKSSTGTDQSHSWTAPDSRRTQTPHAMRILLTRPQQRSKHWVKMKCASTTNTTVHSLGTDLCVRICPISLASHCILRGGLHPRHDNIVERVRQYQRGLKRRLENSPPIKHDSCPTCTW